MTLKAHVESLDDVDAKFHDAYSLCEDDKDPRNGKFVLGIEGADGFELINPTRLKTALSKERGTNSDLSKKVSAFEGIDPDAARTALDRMSEYEKFDPEKEADKIAQEKYRNLESQLKTQHGKKIGELEETLGKTKGALHKALVETAASREIEKNGGDVALLLPHVVQFAKLKETDDGYAIDIVDEKGFTRIGNDGSEHMSMADLVAEMKEHKSFGRAFDADEKSGADTSPKQNSSRSSRTISKAPADWSAATTPAEKVAFLDRKRQKGR